ncbi:MAG: hypothetical protein JSW25_10205, partial [Thermoplasmata archaeon]
MLLTLLAPAGVSADIHDPVTGRADVSDDADATAPITGDQTTSDVAMDHLGRVHVTWQDNRAGRFNVMYSRSDNGGMSFGPSIRVNEPRPSIDFMSPSIDVDGDGNPFIVWHDPRNSITTGLDIYMARSYDGGDTFG